MPRNSVVQCYLNISYWLHIKSGFTSALPVLQSMDSAVNLMIQETRHLEDLEGVRHLDDLIFLLQGRLDRISLRKWPFLLAHVLPQDSAQELNLVV
jgi:hypothetical protein